MMVNWIIVHRIWQSNYFLKNAPLTSICADNMLCTFIYEAYALTERRFRLFFPHAGAILNKYAIFLPMQKCIFLTSKIYK